MTIEQAGGEVVVVPGRTPVDEEGRTAGAFGPNMDRLAAVKREYDPENRFRRNQNIQPVS